MWVDVTLEELAAFLRVIMNIALNFKAYMVDYFSAEWLDSEQCSSKMLFLSEVCLFALGAASCSSHGTSSKIKNISEYIDTKCKEIIFQGNMYQLRRAH